MGEQDEVCAFLFPTDFRRCTGRGGIREEERGVGDERNRSSIRTLSSMCHNTHTHTPEVFES